MAKKLSRSYKHQIEDYVRDYGKIPMDENDILLYLKDELKLKDTDFQKIEEMNKIEQEIPWEIVKIVLPIIPRPTPRPRYSGRNGSFYVAGASENKKLFKYYVKEKYNIIYTQTYMTLNIYLPTPLSSMNRIEVYRAEQKSILPTSNPDFDNLAKTYSDMIQDILILNDNIITKGFVQKFYSVKPRVEIILEYQKGFDSKYNKNKMTRSSKYHEAIESEESDAGQDYTGEDQW